MLALVFFKLAFQLIRQYLILQKTKNLRCSQEGFFMLLHIIYRLPAVENKTHINIQVPKSIGIAGFKGFVILCIKL